MNWLTALRQLQESRTPAVLVTVTDVRGHAPRNAGAKMVVAANASWGTIGGGQLEETTVRHARTMLTAHAAVPITQQFTLSDKARPSPFSANPGEHAVQCCGGDVTVLLEPIGVRPAVAIFGMGHVGFEIAWLLSRHDLELHLVDSRAEQLGDDRLAAILNGPANVHVHHLPVLPEAAITDLPERTHALVLTHDHAEDLAITDALLRSSIPASIGLIGSAAKWARFRVKLSDLGHTAQSIDRVRTPIGVPDHLAINAKTPAAISVAVVAELLRALESDPAIPVA